jgi:hypothetical protein
MEKGENTGCEGRRYLYFFWRITIVGLITLAWLACGRAFRLDGDNVLEQVVLQLLKPESRP